MLVEPALPLNPIPLRVCVCVCVCVCVYVLFPSQNSSLECGWIQ